MTIESLPRFTAPAAKRWKAIPETVRRVQLSNIWCGQCRQETTITNFSGTMKGKGVLLSGKCAVCKGDVARFLEGEGM